MAEVQQHGNKFEDVVIRDRTKLSKKEYDKLKKNGYTSPFDLCNGLKVDYDASIKTTGSNTVCCSDLLRMMSHRKYYRLIVGCYKQEGKSKKFHTQYEFFIAPEDYSKLWGKMDYQLVESFVDFVKAIPHGPEAQKDTKSVRDQFQEQVSCEEALFNINPKVDSKKQRRVQCSVPLDKLLASGIQYEKTTLNLTINSSRRKFNK
tara:strand:+ start:646 stop:1257 length:612 start_codon:yes stop_codon:yes gene_type:complete